MKRIKWDAEREKEGRYRHSWKNTHAPPSVLLLVRATNSLLTPHLLRGSLLRHRIHTHAHTTAQSLHLHTCTSLEVLRYSACWWLLRLVVYHLRGINKIKIHMHVDLRKLQQEGSRHYHYRCRFLYGATMVLQSLPQPRVPTKTKQKGILRRYQFLSSSSLRGSMINKIRKKNQTKYNGSSAAHSPLRANRESPLRKQNGVLLCKIGKVYSTTHPPYHGLSTRRQSRKQRARR